jgi:hypothetical protein
MIIKNTYIAVSDFVLAKQQSQNKEILDLLKK